MNDEEWISQELRASGQLIIPLYTDGRFEHRHPRIRPLVQEREVAFIKTLAAIILL
jgi:hypothetical protein